MRSFLRFLGAVIVAAACAGQPIALDACSAACESARADRAAVQPCHHAAPGGQIRQPARPCGQDHAVVPGRSTGSAAPAPTFGLVSTLAPRFGSAMASPPIADGSPGPPLIARSIASSTPLRV